jgi:flagellar assembly factor FliW
MTYTVTVPVLGFESVEKFELSKIDDVFYRLTAVGEGIPSFTLIQPAAVRTDYSFELPDAIAKKLELTREEDALVLNIMILDTPLEKSHINFIAPLVFNKANGKMAQVVLDAVQYADYGVAEPLKNYLTPADADA